jgi:hypothetical protein
MGTTSAENAPTVSELQMVSMTTPSPRLVSHSNTMGSVGEKETPDRVNPAEIGKAASESWKTAKRSKTVEVLRLIAADGCGKERRRDENAGVGTTR